eukprot:5078216-Lingulodinium_polyedra.AAC.1
MHSTVAAPRVSRRTRSMRRPLRGGRRVECARREMRGAAVAKFVVERVSQHSCARGGQEYRQACCSAFHCAAKL